MTTTGAVSGTPSPRPLWLTETYPPSRGGMAESCDRIVRSLRAAGVTVDVGHLVRRLGASARFEEQEGGRYWAWPIEDDPAHASEPRVERVVAGGARAALVAARR